MSYYFGVVILDKKLYIDNLHIYNTLECNFRCGHCMLGDTIHERISTEVLEKLFENILMVGVLRFIGGESLMSLDTIRETLRVMKEKNIVVFKLRITTNGSLYTEEAEKVFDEFSEYIELCRSKHKDFMDDFGIRPTQNVGLIWSIDEYHQDYFYDEVCEVPSLAEFYAANMQRLESSNHFLDVRGASGLFKTGKAESLPEALDDVDNYHSYYYEDEGMIFVAPCLNVLTDGTITEHNGSIEDLKTRFNYGNIMKEDVRDIIRRRLEKTNSLLELSDKQYEEVGRFNRANGFDDSITR